jgi:hypothetical protein
VETGLLLLCVGLAGFIAIFEFGQLRHRMKRDDLVADLQQIAAVLEKHHAQKGEWPAATSPDQPIPRGLEAELARTRWSAGTPFGGAYHWTPPLKTPGDKTDAASPPPGHLAVTAFSPSRPLGLTRADLRYIDQKIDDGNLSTGRFQSGFNGWPVLHVHSSR